MRCGLARFFRNQDAASAVEFSLVGLPLVLFLCGIVCFGILYGTYNGVEQLAAESARAAVAGQSASERDQLARNFVTANIGSYGFLNPANLTITTSSQQPTETFQVTVRYDMSASPIFQLAGVLAAASPIITRSAAVQFGGF
jgi:Flp pilus assembly protein TadG